MLAMTFLLYFEHSLDSFPAVVEISADLSGVFNPLGKVDASSPESCSCFLLKFTQFAFLRIQFPGAFRC